LWYTEYLRSFVSVPYLIPEELEKDFDRSLLAKFVAGSFSSDWVFDTQVEWDMPEFVISVQSGDQIVVKKASELRWFQILRLYEIYTEEQMNLQILMMEEEKEKDSILTQRQEKIDRWKIILDNIANITLEKEEKTVKDQKLQNLYQDLW
jgi:hypothetical protein